MSISNGTVHEDNTTYPLIIHDGDLFNASEAGELIVEVTLGGANAETEDAEYTGWVRSLARQLGSTHDAVTNT